MSKKIFPSLFLLALLGLASSIVLTFLHYKIGRTGLEARSFCHVSDFFDCDAALASRYSRIGPFLTSELGVLYYLLLSFGMLYARVSEKQRDGTLAFFFLAGLFAFAYSLVVAWLSVSKLGILCLLCFVTYLVNLLILLFLPRAMQTSLRSIPALWIRQTGPMIRMAVVTLLVTGVGLLFFKGLSPQIRRSTSSISREAYLQFFYSRPRKEMVIPERPFWGSREAKVTIVEFSDFQCPFCKVAAFTLKPYLKEFREKVRLVFLNYPLDSACNPLISHSMHPTACLAAKAALCAYDQEKFWDTHDLIFENQKRLSRDTLLRLAGKAGLDLASFDRCLASDETSALLKEDLELGTRLEVQGTPAIFINGRPFRDWSDPERLRMVIEEEASNPSVTPPSSSSTPSPSPSEGPR